ncbi:deoxyribodipyrimidine photolyase [Botrimarina hoheduenensis]|uniref:Deoxyribodipyrimidine photo-lyase n=1 Tax=Botrimarina hoheduenensis TaxID=2528000 RepID=A0A5C5WDL3_9BACT|nr:deoxyribodipyrimidine photolyase [Botrimarina hoheduenensis]TWT48784.1 deoxyribodipyrimidine photolyase [Botrimarina hoheduenensis]
MQSEVPAIRLRAMHGEAGPGVNQGGRYVLYWMTAFRRVGWNFALQRVVDWARELGKPMVVLEALRIDYPWACDRFHTYVVQGMHDNHAALQGVEGVAYYPYLEPERGAAAGLLRTLAAEAAVVVSDEYPCFFLPAQARAARRSIPCRYELVDSNGLYPLRATPKSFSRAFDFRRHLQKELLPHLSETPAADPLKNAKLPSAKGIVSKVTARWPAVKVKDLAAPDKLIASLPIDHQVQAVTERGGSVAARAALDRFLDDRLEAYATDRNQPEQEVASGLSFPLHWGHLSAHEVFAELTRRERWTPQRLAAKANGSSEGWWGMSPNAEGFLDELITWREVGYQFTSKRRDYDRYESLPDWAQRTLSEHEHDPREHVYSLEAFENARTHDELWNAAQRQLLREGRIHNYLRMLWGKKILHWSATPRDALAVMLELNNKYAIDGRDPNSYSGIFWVLGRFDRAWGPERPIFGKIRYMTSDNTARKVRVKDYLKRYAAESTKTLF